MIDISTIVKSINKETTIETELTLTSFESRLGDYPILKKQPISLHISNVENAAVHITGTVDIDIAIPCSRCLEEVPTNMHFDIDKTLKIIDGAGYHQKQQSRKQKPRTARIGAFELFHYIPLVGSILVGIFRFFTCAGLVYHNYVTLAIDEIA